MVGQQIGGPGSRCTGAPRRCSFSHALRSPALLVVTSMTSPWRADRLDQGRRDRAAAGHEHQHGRRERLLDDLDQPGHVGRQQPPGVAHDHHAEVDQEGRGQAGVDDGADVELVARAAADLLDDECVVPVADDLGQERAHLLGDQRGVVACTR